MTDPQPLNIIEGADIDEDVSLTAKSAEDRKAAAAMAKLDSSEHDEGNSKEVDQEAMSKAMGVLAGAKAEAKKDAKKIVKVNPADVEFVVCGPF